VELRLGDVEVGVVVDVAVLFEVVRRRQRSLRRVVLDEGRLSRRYTST